MWVGRTGESCHSSMNTRLSFSERKQVTGGTRKHESRPREEAKEADVAGRWGARAEWQEQGVKQASIEEPEGRKETDLACGWDARESPPTRP